jgi:rod shape determining protein RodA
MKRRLRLLDVTLLVVVVVLLGTGLRVIYSTAMDTPREALFERHLISIAVAIGVFLLVASLPYRVLEWLAYPVYTIAVLALLAVLLAGTIELGARRWFVLGPLRIQPSEPAKLATLLALAHYFAEHKVDRPRAGIVARALAIVALPAILILQQPDLGTALAYVALALTVLHWVGAPLSWVLYTAALGVTGFLAFRLPPIGMSAATAGVVESAGEIALLVGLLAAFLVLVAFVMGLRRRVTRRLLVVTLLVHVGVAIASPYAWSQLEDYQRQRVLTFMSPGRDPTGTGYQVIQSKIAIGSGGLTGKGFQRGTQKALAYLPQQHTDFVFSVIGEEAGFRGSVFVIALFGILLYRGVHIARIARDRFASVLAIGAVGILGYHIVVNLFMTMGFAPVTGLPLPFISYGGSFLVSTMALVGVLEGIAMQRHG